MRPFYIKTELKTVLRALAQMTIALSLSSHVLAEDKSSKEDCACEQVTCGPCQKEVVLSSKVKFCDWGEMNVCREIVCENVAYYFSCLANLEKKEETVEEKDALAFDYEVDRKNEVKRQKKEARTIASVQAAKVIDHRGRKFKLPGRKEIDLDVQTTPVAPLITSADVVRSSGLLEVFHQGQVLKIKKGQTLYVGDEVLNNSPHPQSLNLKFPGGVVQLRLQSKSRLIFEDPNSIVGRFQPFLYLVHGGVDIDLNFKEGALDILAGQILSRKTKGKAKLEYQMEERGLIVRAENLEGDLAIIRAKDLSGASVPISSGEFITWVSETPQSLFNLDEKLALAHEGFLTPVFAMSPQRKKELGILPLQEAPLFEDWTQKAKESSRGQQRGLASIGELCQKPSGQFQQCAWSCEGNPKGAQSCQAGQGNAFCVRRECNAAGEWGSPTPFATSYRDLCPAQGVRVGSCSALDE